MKEGAAYCAGCGVRLGPLQSATGGRQVQMVSNVQASQASHQQPVIEDQTGELRTSLTRDLADSERALIKRLGSKERFAASLVGFIGAALGVMTMVTPASDPTILGAETAILFLVGMALAARSRRLRSAVAWALERGTLTQATGRLRSLANGERVVDFGDSYMPLSKERWTEITSIPDGTPFHVDYAGPSLQAKPKIVAIRSDPPSLAEPAVLPLVSAT